jgi:hypothetical protein
MVTSSIGGMGGTATGTGYGITTGWIPGTVAGNGFDLSSSNLGSSVITFALGPPPTTTILVPGTVVNPTISFSNILTSHTVPIGKKYTITSTLPEISSVVIFPGTIITGPVGWNGILQLPVEKTHSSVGGLIGSSVPDNVIFLGLSGFDLTLNQPIRIFLPTTAIHAAFEATDGSTTNISTACVGDDVVTETAQLVGGLNACSSLTAGGIFIWTLHFSTFFSYNIVVGGILGDRTAPTLTGSSFSPSESALTINDNHFSLPSSSNTITTTAITTGTHAQVQVLVFEDSGPDAITGVVLYTNISGSQGATASDTYIVWNKNQPLGVYNPNGLFSSVKLTNAVQSNKMLFTYDIVFAKPMQNPNLIIRTWDQRGNFKDVSVANAWQVTGSVISPTVPSTPQPTAPLIQQPTAPLIQQPTTPLIQQPTAPTTPQNAATPPEVGSSEILSAVKDWGGYSSHPITDSEFLKALNINDATHIPSWVAKTTKWVADGSVSLQEFQAAMAYLYQTHAIK